VLNMKSYVRYGSERGAMLVQVGLSILVLSAFTAFVVDSGVQMVARNQAQNAADAGALAGAIARAYDDPASSPASGGKTEMSARNAARCATGAANCPDTPASANPVWPSQAAASSAVNVSWDCPPGFSGRCARVDVYRNGEFASTALPTYFGNLMGVTSQGVKATASARVAGANSVTCLRPYAIADKWVENGTTANQFNRWAKVGGVVTELTPHDIYTPPTATDYGTGYRLPPATPHDYGTQKVLINGSTTQSSIPPGWSVAVNLPDGEGGYTSGSSEFRNQIVNCNPNPVSIGDYLPTENMGTGPTLMGTAQLILKDPLATWDSTNKKVTNTCAPACGPMSPRIVPIPVFDIDEYQWRKVSGNWSVCPGGGECVRVVNILGFFVSHIGLGLIPSTTNITGYLVAYPGQLTGTALSDTASFLTAVQLIR
jgi:hypothetical protein